jgi:putative endonuclease
MITPKTSLGKLGESKACQYLKSKDYRIINANFQTRLGEIDIICQKNDLLVFVEVKARIGDLKGKPYESITYWKLKHLKKAIYFYLIKKNLLNSKLRIDVISIEFNPDKTVKKLLHFENVELPAFSG